MKAKILISDDNDVTRTFLMNVLVKAGYLVYPAVDGKDALEKIERLKPDLILLDIIMPQISGLEVAGEIKKNMDLKDIPIIFISSLTDEEDILKGFEKGGVDYITKPFRPEELLVRVKTHLKLRNLSNELDNFFKVNFGILCVMDRDFTIVRLNKQAEKLFGCDSDNIKGARLLDFIHPDDLKVAEEELSDIQRGRPSVSFCGRLKYGSSLENSYFEWYCSLYQGRIYAFAHDVTERFIYETELENKNHELEGLVRVISTELRTPMLNIKGFTDNISSINRSLQKKVQSKNLEPFFKDTDLDKFFCETDESVEIIRQSLSKMDELFVQFSYLSQNTAGRINPAIIQMDSLLMDIISNYQNKISKDKITVELDKLPDCFADEFMVMKIFENIFDNSLKFLNPHEAGKIRISGRVEGSSSIYIIEDNGIGIEEKYYKKIFQLFYQIDKKAKGKGLGLAVAQKLLNRLNGKLWVNSRYKKGSAFMVQLPVRKD